MYTTRHQRRHLYRDLGFVWQYSCWRALKFERSVDTLKYAKTIKSVMPKETYLILVIRAHHLKNK